MLSFLALQIAWISTGNAQIATDLVLDLGTDDSSSQLAGNHDSSKFHVKSDGSVHDVASAMRWWNVLNGEQMVAILAGQVSADRAKKPYAGLDDEAKELVNDYAAAIYGAGMHASVGDWWGTLDCRLMRIAAGDGNTVDPSSRYCAHYPGSGAAKIVSFEAYQHINLVGQALLGRSDPGIFPPDNMYAERWWNVLNGEEMTAVLYGQVSAERAKKPYAGLDAFAKDYVNGYANEIFSTGMHASVGDWWGTLDCRLMRIAAGDGNSVDSSSPFCAHYPGSGAAKIVSFESYQHINLVGQALLGRSDPGIFPPDNMYAERWWNVLNGEEMIAVLYGQVSAERAKKPYAGLDAFAKDYVNGYANEIFGAGMHASVGDWWGTLDCRLMRIAAGEGNTADPSSRYCAHYPGSGAAKIVSYLAFRQINKVGQALLGRDDPGVYPPDNMYAERWWNVLDGEQMVAVLEGYVIAARAKKPYAELDAFAKDYVNIFAVKLFGDGMHATVGHWWESLNCHLMRVAAGDGNRVDLDSPFCARYPGSGAAKIISFDAYQQVNLVGQALLGRDEPGDFVADDAYAERWWNVLNGEEMAAVLRGQIPATRAKKPYDDLDTFAKEYVNNYSTELLGDGMHASVGDWWQTLDCRLMRIAAGDGNTVDPSSPFCAHYPGSGADKIVSFEAYQQINKVGLALLGRDDLGIFPPDNKYAERWWNVLNGEEMAAVLDGQVSPDRAKKPYDGLDAFAKDYVNGYAIDLLGDGMHDSVGAWWGTLDCRLMRIAAGDGNSVDPSSPFCAHYPGSGADKIVSFEAYQQINKVGLALLGRDELGIYPADNMYAERWWNVLNGEEMAAVLDGQVSAERAKKPYDGLDAFAKDYVNGYANDLLGDGMHDSVGAWWGTLDCRLMRIAAGDGNTVDPSSPFCAHYPGSGADKIVSFEAYQQINKVGLALLDRKDLGIFPPDNMYALRWWNVLNGEQMAAVLDGQVSAERAKKPYAGLDAFAKDYVNGYADELLGDGMHDSVGAWWGTLDCRLMRIAAGDGNTADPSSPFCAQYPGSGADKIVSFEAYQHINVVGQALLDRDDPGVFPDDNIYAERWWNVLNGEQMAAVLDGQVSTERAKKPYAELDAFAKDYVNGYAIDILGNGMFASVGDWWQTLDCRLMRIAAGDGNTADPSSAFCAHYPGTDNPNILSNDAYAFVNVVGMALLDRDVPGVYPADDATAQAWWSVLTSGERNAVLSQLDGVGPTSAEYASLSRVDKGIVNRTAIMLVGSGSFSSVGHWWQSLDCRYMRIAAGDGGTADPTSPYCAHYPGTGAAKILGTNELTQVNEVGMALLGRTTPGNFAPGPDVSSHVNRVLAAVVPEAAKASISSTVQAVSQRLDTQRRSGQTSMASTSALVHHFDDQSISLMSPFDAAIYPSGADRGFGIANLSSFDLAMPLNSSDGELRDFSVWLSGDMRSLGGTNGTVSWDGDLQGIHVGADVGIGSSVITGISVSDLTTDLEYNEHDGNGELTYSVQTIQPYLGANLNQNWRVWGTISRGSGDIELARAEAEEMLSTDATQNMFAGGFEGRLSYTGCENTKERSLVLKGDLARGSVELDETQVITDMSADINRTRIVLEANQNQVLEGGHGLGMNAGIGLRNDSGDALTGQAFEVNGGFQFRDASGRASVRGDAWTLLNGEDDQEEWGLSAQVRFQASSTGKGFSLALTPTLGAKKPILSSSPWDQWRRPNLHNVTDQDSALRLRSELGYGFAIPSFDALFNANLEAMRITDDISRYRLGLSMEQHKRINALGAIIVDQSQIRGTVTGFEVKAIIAF